MYIYVYIYSICVLLYMYTYTCNLLLYSYFYGFNTFVENCICPMEIAMKRIFFGRCQSYMGWGPFIRITPWPLTETSFIISRTGYTMAVCVAVWTNFPPVIIFNWDSKESNSCPPKSKILLLVRLLCRSSTPQPPSHLKNV